MYMKIHPDNLLVIPIEKKLEMAEIDVSPIVEIREKKDKHGRVVARLSYVPWIEARILLETHFPGVEVAYEMFPRERGTGDPTPHLVPWADYGNTGAAVYPYLVEVATGKRTMPLFFPVMDFRHNSAIDPTATDINTALQRAAAKCVAVQTWIGISVYRRENDDIPPEETEIVPQKRQLPGKYEDNQYPPQDYGLEPEGFPFGANGSASQSLPEQWNQPGQNYQQDAPTQRAASSPPPTQGVSRFKNLGNRLK